MKFEFSGKNLEKLRNIRFHENPWNGRRVVAGRETDGWTDGRTEGRTDRQTDRRRDMTNLITFIRSLRTGHVSLHTSTFPCLTNQAMWRYRH